MGRGRNFARAATRVVASDRMPICMTRIDQQSQTEPTQKNEDYKGRDGIRIWSLNVRGISSEARLKELDQESLGSKQGMLLIQETWRMEETERLDIGNWIFYGTGKKENRGETGQGYWFTNQLK